MKNSPNFFGNYFFLKKSNKNYKNGHWEMMNDFGLSKHYRLELKLNVIQNVKWLLIIKKFLSN